MCIHVHSNITRLDRITVPSTFSLLLGFKSESQTSLGARRQVHMVHRFVTRLSLHSPGPCGAQREQPRELNISGRRMVGVEILALKW